MWSSKISNNQMCSAFRRTTSRIEVRDVSRSQQWESLWGSWALSKTCWVSLYSTLYTHRHTHAPIPRFKTKKVTGYWSLVTAISNDSEEWGSRGPRDILYPGVYEYRGRGGSGLATSFNKLLLHGIISIPWGTWPHPSPTESKCLEELGEVSFSKGLRDLGSSLDLLNQNL